MGASLQMGSLLLVSVLYRGSDHGLANEGAAEHRLLRKGRGSGRPEIGDGSLALAVHI